MKKRRSGPFKTPPDKLIAGRARNKAWRINKPQTYLWHHARMRARRKKLPFTITPQDIPLPTHCEVFGVKLIYGTGGRAERDLSASVDRIEPRHGYVPGNIRVISFRANFLRSTGTLAEFETICDWLRRQLQQRAA